MRTTALLSLAISAPTALAAVNNTFLAGLAQALSNSGLTQLASIAAKVNSTDIGQGLLSALPDGNFTIFAPDNNAFNNVPSNVSSNATLLAQILSYHILPGDFSAPAATAPNLTVGRTLLNASSLVQLEGNKSQVLVWSIQNGTTYISNQNNITFQGNTTHFENLTIHTITGVLSPPGDINTTLQAAGLTGVAGIVGNVAGLPELIASAHGYTLFAPNNDAISSAASSLGTIAGNQSLLLTVLQNHVINGTSAYSPLLLGGANYTTAAGESLSVHSNSSGRFVTVGSASALIVQTDILVSNGVVHVIDGVLADLSSNSSAASSAFASATSAAAAQPTPTGPLAPSSSGSSSSSGNSGKKGGAAALRGGLANVVVGALVGVVLVL